MASSLYFCVAAVLPAILCIHGIKGQRKLAASPYKSKPKFEGSVAHHQQGLSKSPGVCRFISEDNHWTVYPGMMLSNGIGSLPLSREAGTPKHMGYEWLWDRAHSLLARCSPYLEVASLFKGPTTLLLPMLLFRGERR